MLLTFWLLLPQIFFADFLYGPAVNYMFKVNNKGTRARYEISLKFSIFKAMGNAVDSMYSFSQFFLLDFSYGTAVNYMFKVNKKNTRTRCKICSKLKIKTPERRHWRRTDVFIVNFEHISHLVLRASWWCIIDKILVQMKPK